MHVPAEEIARLTHPLTARHARIRCLRRQGFTVLVQPDGDPYISLDNYRRVTGGEPPAPPAADALQCAGPFATEPTFYAAQPPCARAAATP